MTAERALVPFPPRRAKRDAAASCPLRLVVPQACLHCESAEGQVSLASTVDGGIATVRWRCGQCLHEWPVRASEQDAADRRMGNGDRRRRTRSDRRQTP